MSANPIGSAIELATAVFTFLDHKSESKYLDRLTKAQLSLLEEKGKGQLASDRIIEELNAEIDVLFQAAKQKVELSGKR